MDQAALRAFLGGWPGVEASIKWGEDLVFCVAGKMFCVTRDHGTGPISFKVEDDRFLELTERPGFEPAPYLARSHWVMVAEPGRVPADELRAFLRRSYELARAKLPKKTQRELAD
ncbi:MmcQ/YjbR family DNA-binding protein [Lysobacter auxotrophicus]|uniref:MmcQ/YjbR family DNA-binding protein n=1 Tax=Lysobacter auxotrophicus TaxID=2992573 RepID=A0ABM8DFB9_9GAMM|nr:MmcQ/YjbR family DNA-binding protein [Lysobacter auxotrophicus]